jgi:twitching motility protein PilT
LLKKVSGGRVAAWEIMIANSAIRNLIREAKVPQMYSVIQTSHGEGMQTLDQHLQDLVRNRIIAMETARTVAVDKSKFVTAPTAQAVAGGRRR